MGVGKGERAVGGRAGVGGGQGGVKDVFPVRPWKGRMLGELEPVHPVGESG